MSNHTAELIQEVASAGVVTFGTAWADEEHEHFAGYRLGNGQTLIVHSFDNGEPVMHLVRDEDARKVHTRFQEKQLNLAWHDGLKFEDKNDSILTTIMDQDLWEGITCIEMPESEPLKMLPGDVELRAQFEARELARREERVRKNDEYLDTLRQETAEWSKVAVV